ncbi:hypothetical protein TSAR_016295 [Trichomalopsis sarcophagae]|uniref:Gustatory receptor n=1 Tax=Trichomalopsis sarcophagae TaxID=543379 RepID=A0A232F4C5_9HYME|nr:hypothetical protein TSAR_016295 [Trichomalopsis sarcophagae]
MKRTTKNGDSMFQVNFSLPPLQKASYAKNSSGGNSPSSSIQDIRPTFLIARVFGLAPYAITNSSINVSKRGILYSVPWLGFYLYALYNRLNLYTHSDLETKFRILSVTRTALAVIALLVDLVVCTFRDDRFQSALDCVRKYDLAVKYDVETNARLMRIHSWTVYSFMITYYLAIGWFTYFNEPYEGVMAAVIYVYLYLPLSIAVMKFVALITSILLRFRHLHRMLFPGFLSIMMELDSEPKRLHLRDVCWLHSCLCAAAANVNSLYSLQLMLWFANLMFNTISRINDFGQPQNNIDAFKLARDAGLVLIFVTLVFFIAGVCHVTSTQANKVGAVVFSPGSRYFRSRVAEHQDKEDKFCIGQYFALHPLHFSAASGFFRINLSLLLKGGIMVNLSDIKPLFYAARFFGCAPHRVTDSDILLTTTGLIYSGIWALGFVCCCCYGLLLICADAHTGERNILALTAVRTLLAYVCFFADDALTMRWNERLRSALLQLRNFDLAVGYGRKRSVNWKLRCCCWMLVGTIIAYWIGVGYFTYKCEMTNPLFNAITYVIANAAISMQLIKFAGLLMLLRQRFRYLRELLPSEGEILLQLLCGYKYLLYNVRISFSEGGLYCVLSRLCEK